jgi:4-hydroxythreonine-4-phosphate dehydrogenase
MKKPLIAITIGDPAGIGPEIVVKTIADKGTFELADCVVVGDAKIIAQTLAVTGDELVINCIQDPSEGDYSEGVLNLIDLGNIDMEQFEYGKVSAMCGHAAYEYIEKGIQLTMDGKADAISTAPINKEALRAAGVDFIGHTEIFGALTGTNDPLTMFETNGMRIFFLTRHVSLRNMVDMITKERIIDYVERCTEALVRLGVTEGTMAVAGLNPHSGEHGLFGTEEVDEIAPELDDDLRCQYFEQAENGMYIRMALVAKLIECERRGRAPVYPIPKASACQNPRCITNHEKILPIMLKEVDGETRCKYCDHSVEAGNARG